MHSDYVLRGGADRSHFLMESVQLRAVYSLTVLDKQPSTHILLVSYHCILVFWFLGFSVSDGLIRGTGKIRKIELG